MMEYYQGKNRAISISKNRARSKTPCWCIIWAWTIRSAGQTNFKCRPGPDTDFRWEAPTASSKLHWLHVPHLSHSPRAHSKEAVLSALLGPAPSAPAYLPPHQLLVGSFTQGLSLSPHSPAFLLKSPSHQQLTMELFRLFISSWVTSSALCFSEIQLLQLSFQMCWNHIAPNILLFLMCL